jgi:hypothetical protein
MNCSWDLSFRISFIGSRIIYINHMFVIHKINQMNLKFLFISILIVTLVISAMDSQIFSIAFAQSSDKSFKGAEAPFIPTPGFKRIPKAPPSDGISINNLPLWGLEDTLKENGGEEKDRDRLPPSTETEIKELPFGNINDSVLTDLKIISTNTSFTYPIKNITGEIMKNDTLILDDDNINSFNSSKFKNKFDDTHVEQIFIAQDMSQDLETNIETSKTEMNSNTTGDHKDDDDNIISSLVLPNPDIFTLINNTKVDSTVIEASEEGQQTAATDELTKEDRNFTKTVTQNNEDDLEDEGKTITIEEIPMQSEESHNEWTTEGNVTIKGLLKVNNTK